ncbi:MAG: PEP/pyruvate-binding domain-containing protein [Nitrospirota bacterium]
MTTRNTATSSEQYDILREVVRDYPGIVPTVEPLLRELYAASPDWEFVIKELRAYSLKNFSLHDHHEKGAVAVRAVIDIFLAALHNTEVRVQEPAGEGLIFYLEKIMLDGTHDTGRYGQVLDDCIARMTALPDEQFFLIVTNPHQIKKLGELILEKTSSGVTPAIFSGLIRRFFSHTYGYWLRQKDPVTWAADITALSPEQIDKRAIEELLYPVSHANINALMLHLEKIGAIADQEEQLRELLQLPGYMQLAKYYEDAAGSLAVTGNSSLDEAIRMRYLLKIMGVNGLSGIHENILREIHRTFSALAKTADPGQVKTTLSAIFTVFRNTVKIYPETVLACIQRIGNDIYTKSDSGLVEWFLQKVITLGFQHPGIQGVTEEWQVQSNRAHLKNIRVWLELIENDPKWSKSLIAALVINLSLGGVHISDTDIFQKDITKLLNSEIKPVYHLIKQAAKLCPVYFSDIGAEGSLRQVSTELDESTYRTDPLIHFLRKQSHVESSARVVDFIEEVVRFWLTKDKTPLQKFLPHELFAQIESSGQFIDEVHMVFQTIFSERKISSAGELLYLTDEELLLFTEKVPGVSEREKRRAYLIIRFYQLLNRKYKLAPQDIRDQLHYAPSLGLPNTDSLVELLEQGTISERLEGVLGYLEALRDTILSAERYEPVENIFRKRHIAAGIPSLYGKYHERKFDALALTFRLENLANILFEELLNSVNFTFITRATLFQIEKYAALFFKALQLDGISSNRFEQTLELLSVSLEVRRFSFSQYIDIFRGFSEAVQDILTTYYSDTYKNNLKQIILLMGADHILAKYLPHGEKQTESEFVNTISEQFLREIVAGSFGLQQLDTFISRILKTLFEQAEGLDVQNLDLLMSYDPKKALSSIYFPNKATTDRIHLGNKGHNLIKLASLGIPVPPGFIITTEVFRCEKAINRFKQARDHLEEGIREQITILENLTGKEFGNPQNPLLVSVRSGGAISMPGMMISFLNVGMNELIAQGLITRTGKPWFVWDCYRRFLQGWGMSYGIERDKFDEMMNSHKGRYHVQKKIQFTPEQMRELALSYRRTIMDQGIEVSDDPLTQLRTAIEQVFQSWFSKKAQAYREIMGMSENWGTAVIVQTMAYGNLDTNSGAGVLFTRNPLETGDRVTLWGDFAIGSQGEDIVSGLVRTLPISNAQKPFEDRTSEISFEDTFPEIYSTLLKISKKLIYDERWGAQEIEFTFEGKSSENLSILQTRDMALTRKESFMAFVPSKKLTSSYLSRGIGVGGGALSGRVVFDLDEIRELRTKDPETPLILIRSDTVPDDIRHISAADGLLTARGGSTSHASIIASRLGKTCIVGCNHLTVWEQEKKCRINNTTITGGDFLSIDGRNGSVYSGKHRVREIMPETGLEV